MRFDLYPQDNWFTGSTATYTLDTRCEMSVALGLSGFYVTSVDPLSRLLLSKFAYVYNTWGLKGMGIWNCLDLAGDTSGNADFLKILTELQGCDTVELALFSSDSHCKVSDPIHDGRAKELLQGVLAIAEKKQITISLYPHTGMWMEKTGDAVRLCNYFDSSYLRVSFTGFHWFSAESQCLRDSLNLIQPYLHRVNISGAKKNFVGETSSNSIELLDHGDLDNFAVVNELLRINYSGPIGMVGYSIKGDTFSKLSYSCAKFREIEERITAHPEWCNLTYG